MILNNTLHPVFIVDNKDKVMKINYLQISNILCFEYHDDIANAEKIDFDKKLSIIIGQNGAGKSTVLEVINFIFKKVLFSPYSFNRESYSNRVDIAPDQKRKTVLKTGSQDYIGFRLEPNWSTEQSTQKIRVEISLDDIDRSNIELLKTNKTSLSTLVGSYTQEAIFSSEDYQETYILDIELSPINRTFTVTNFDDLGFTYLVRYYFYKKLIDIFNLENRDNQITTLEEPFAIIGGYRNYNSFTASVSLGGKNSAPVQIDQINDVEYKKSTNTNEQAEPTIFSLVRLRMAGVCQELITSKKDQAECEKSANDQEFVKLINNKLEIVNLRIQISLDDVPSWSYSFNFIDIKTDRVLKDINSLSAGQKAIIHLVFEAYGRGELRGGLVVIDEPEIHLHYQFQDEYVRVLDQLNVEQGCQYVLVTHSESLINSSTIENVIRLSLDENRHSKVNKPVISTSQKWLIKILDNKRSSHAFFGSKVLLVEGEDDKYFFRAVLNHLELKLKKGIAQDISILDINDKKKHQEWRNLFESFGLKVFFVTDFDSVFNFFYSTETFTKLNNESLVTAFKGIHTDVISRIDSEYLNANFILKEGDLEFYLDINKDLLNVINFCQTNLATFMSSTTNTKSLEIKKIVSMVTGVNESEI